MLAAAVQMPSSMNAVAPKTPLRVLLADDHALVREGLRALIDAQPDMRVVGEAENGHDAIAQASALAPDVIVLDVWMPQLDGARAAPLLKRARPNAAIIALTACDDAGCLRELLDAGASGYVLKHAAVDELVGAIRAVVTGGVYVDPRIAGELIGGNGARANDGAANTKLSEREAEVLRAIAQGYSNKEIAAQLELSVRTVETYRARSMEKLGLTSRVDIVRYAAEQRWLR
jgi:DNA-binding NarL/FixJ family response regulator